MSAAIRILMEQGNVPCPNIAPPTPAPTGLVMKPNGWHFVLVDPEDLPDAIRERYAADDHPVIWIMKATHPAHPVGVYSIAFSDNTIHVWEVGHGGWVTSEMETTAWTFA